MWKFGSALVLAALIISPAQSTAFLYSSGVYTILNDPLNDPTTGGVTVAQGINNSGVVVGSYSNLGGPFGFVYSNGAYTQLNATPSARVADTAAIGINNLGQIVGTSGALGFLYSSGVFSTVSVPGAVATIPIGINDVGQISGYFTTNGPGNQDIFGFVFSSGKYTIISDPKGTDTFVYGINNSGKVVGQSANEGNFFYSNGAFTPTSIIGTAEGINNLDHAAGFHFPSDTSFIYAAGISETLNPPPNTEIIAFGINDLDQVVGEISAIPEPSTWTMLLIGFVAIGFTGYRSRRLWNPGNGLKIRMHPRGDICGICPCKTAPNPKN
jgi:PEP-CTERM motif